METINITSWSCLGCTLNGFDKFTSLAEFCIDYNEERWKIHGKSLPDKILYSLCYNRNETVIDIMKDFCQCLGDAAYLMKVYGPTKNNMKSHKLIKWFTPSFDHEEKSTTAKYLKLMNAYMQRHKNLVEDIRRSQKKILERCQQNYKPMFHAYSTLDKETFIKAFCEMDKNKSERVAHHIHKTYHKYHDRLLREKRYREELIKVEKQFHEMITTRLTERLEGCIDYMKVVVEGTNCPSHISHILVTKLDDLNAEQIALDIYNRSGRKYTFPKIEEFFKYAGFENTVPNAVLSDYEIFMVKTTSNKTKQYGKPAESECLEALLDYGDKYEIEAEGDTEHDDIGSGIYVRPKMNQKELNKCNLPEFLKLSKNKKIKQKLLLLNGSVGYGWSKKLKFSSKSWGFFNISNVEIECQK